MRSLGGAHLGAAVVDESLGQLPGAAAVKGGLQPVPHPLVGCAAGHAVGDQKDTVSASNWRRVTSGETPSPAVRPAGRAVPVIVG